MRLSFFQILLLLFASCQVDYSQVKETEENDDNTKQQEVNIAPSKQHAEAVSQQLVNPVLNEVEEDRDNKYLWLENNDIKNSLVNRIAVPPGFKRVESKERSFANWLRYLPLKEKGAKVHLFNGDLKANQNVQAEVINIDVGKRDLQQCADAVMRLKAEFHFSQKDFQSIHFNYTSGDKVSFEDWRKGRKPRVNGNRVAFSNRTGHVDNSYKNFQSYLYQIFSYAGTASLEKEMIPQTLSKIKAGDVFIQGGFPGHAVIVVDVAESAKGERLFLLVQSYMPAQEMHVLKNPSDEKISPWYSSSFVGDLITPEWRFTRSDLRQFEN